MDENGSAGRRHFLRALAPSRFIRLNGCGPDSAAPAVEQQGFAGLEFAFSKQVDKGCEEDLGGRGGLHETQIVQHRNPAFLQVPLRPEVVDQNAEMPFIELHRQGVDGEVPAVEIELDRGMFNVGERAGMEVVFEPRRGDIEFEAVGEDDHRRTELVVAAHPAALFPGKGLGELVRLNSQNMRMDRVFALIFYLGIMGLALFGVVAWAEKKLVFWHKSEMVEVRGG